MNKIAVIIVFIFCGIMFAHGPSAFEVDFNPENMELTIKVTHDVKNPKSHYIDKIEIERDSEVIILQVFKVQSDEKVQLAKYIITDAYVGMELKIIASCNKIGKKSFKFIVDEQMMNNKPSAKGTEE
ncbi:hypothetical protein KAH81_06830 [bacterium]|nr:hypothetical protein [bacterium]